jgi:chitodextrinase
MKTAKVTTRRHRVFMHLPFTMQQVELVLAIIVFTLGQNLWAVAAGANPDITPPSVPTGLSMAARSATSIDLSWTASTDDVAVAGYHVFRGGTQVGDVTTNAFSDTSLSPNTGYSYTVSAYDAVPNESAQSSVLVASTLADTLPPSVPTNVHQTGQTTSSITIAWNPSPDNVATTGYEIYRNGSLVKSQAGTTFTDTGLAVYSGYTYNVLAYDAARNASNLSPTLFTSTAQDVTPPSVPDNLHKTSSTISSITLAWDASTDDVGVSGYKVYRDGTLVGSPGGTSFTDSGLSVSSSYTYTVKAADAAGNVSAVSAPYSTSSSNDTTAPSTPTNLHTTSVLDTSIALAWNGSTDDVAVTGYKVYRNGTLIGTTAASTTSITDSGLSPVTNYTYTVRAFDAAGNVSPNSAALSTTTAYDTTAPSVPANLGSPSQTDTSISLTWDTATDNVGVDGYDVYRGGTLITTTYTTNYTDSGRLVNTNYTYRVRAHDASGNNSAQSIPFSINTLPDAVAPTSPVNLASTNQTTTTISIGWDVATDDVAVTGYKVYRDSVYIGTTAGTTYNDASLRYNTSYHYTVTAVDANPNESPASNTLTVSTLPDTVAPLVALTAPAAGNNQLTFAVSATASDDLDLSRVEFYADSTRIATLYSAPFSFNWNSYAVHNGSRVITAKAFDVTGNYASSAVTINVTNPPPAIVGDLNGDHKVNIFDLSTLLSHWNKSGAGDFNNNGKVDIFDLSVLLSHFGNDNSNYN